MWKEWSNNCVDVARKMKIDFLKNYLKNQSDALHHNKKYIDIGR